MKKVITSLLVAATLFGSTKSEPKKEEFWVVGKSYECKWNLKDVENPKVTIISGNMIEFGSKIYFHINSEWDIYSAKLDDSTAYIGLMKDGGLRAFTDDGVLNEYLTCKKK